MPIITATNLKAFLKPGGLSGAQYDTIAGWAADAANQAVVNYCGRSFDKVAEGAETTRVFQPWSGSLAVVDDFWSTTNLVVKTAEDDDGTYPTTWATTDYQVEPFNHLVNGVAAPYYRLRAVGDRYSFTTNNRYPPLQITAAWGWTSVPADVYYATLLKASRLFFRRESPQGVAGFDQFGAVRLSKAEDPDVVSLLDPYRRLDNVVLIG